MTKREFLDRLMREPIVIEPICPVTYYRVALHDDPDPNGGVWLGLAAIGGTLVIDDYKQVRAAVGDRMFVLTYRETERILSRLRQLFTRGQFPPKAIAKRPSST
jgi:hypothetical protein